MSITSNFPVNMIKFEVNPPTPFTLGNGLQP